MGLKNRAKKIMIDAKVPVIDGYNEADQNAEVLFEAARRIGALKHYSKCHKMNEAFCI